MSLPIFWNKQAQVTFDLILEHISLVWGEKEAKKFFNDTQHILKLISKYPYLYKASEIGSQVRKGLISKQTSLFYQVEENRIVLLYFWVIDKCQLFNFSITPQKSKDFLNQEFYIPLDRYW